MFSIFKKKEKLPVDFSGLVTDMHSHLLPGIDDGSTDVDNSLELIKGLQELGFRNFITTPHILWDLYKNTPQTIGAAHQLLQQKLQSEKMDVNISAAAEYFLDDHFDDLLSAKTPFLIIKNKMVLVEFSFLSAPVNYKNLLFNLQIGGYQPILAHPERYTYLAGQKQVFDELKSGGCLFQTNLLSLAGHYGPATSDLAHYLIKKGMIDFLGTDLHHLRHLDALRRANHLMPVVNDLLQSGRLLNPSL